MNHLTAIATALQLLDMGFWITTTYPFGMTRKGQQENGKKPMGKSWGKTRLSRADVEKRFSKLPEPGLGVCLGPGKGPGHRWLVDIEVDDRGSANESLNNLFAAEIVETMGWNSAKGDHRLFFVNQHWAQTVFGSDGHGTRFDGLPGIEVRGLGRGQTFSVVPPSLGTDGQPRRWFECTTIAELPQSACIYLESSVRATATPTPLTSVKRTRPNDGASARGKAALRDECELIANATAGNRHNTFRDAALRIASLQKAGDLSEECYNALARAARQCGLPEKETLELIGFAKGRACARVGTARRSENVTHDVQSKTVTHGLKAEAVTHDIPKAKSCVTESAEQQSCVTDLDKTILNAIRKHAVLSPTDPVREAVFGLRRELDKTARDAGWQDAMWQAVADYWMTESNNRGAKLPNFTTLWPLFSEALGADIREPFGIVLERVRARMPLVEVPTKLADPKLEAYARTMIALIEEHRRHGKGPPFASYDIIADLSGGDNKMKVGRRLRALNKAGYLSRLKVGLYVSGKSSEWDWHNPPLPPGQAKWAEIDQPPSPPPPVGQPAVLGEISDSL